MSCLHQARPSNQAIVLIWRDKDSELSVSGRHDSSSQPKRMCSARKKSLKAGAGKAFAYIYDNIDIPASLHEGKVVYTVTELPLLLCLTILTFTIPVFVNINLFSIVAFVCLSSMKLISKHSDLLALSVYQSSSCRPFPHFKHKH